MSSDRPLSPACGAEAVLSILREEFGLPDLRSDESWHVRMPDEIKAFAATLALEERIGHPLPPALLLEAATADSLAAALENPGLLSSTRPRRLPDAGGEAPLFFLNGGYSVGGLGLAQLGNLLTRRPLSILLSPEILDPETSRDAGRWAEDYAALIRERQPRGPYHLAGYCNSVFFVLETARLLAEAGEKVAFLGIVEPRLSVSRIFWMRFPVYAARRMRLFSFGMAAAAIRGQNRLRRLVGRKLRPAGVVNPLLSMPSITRRRKALRARLPLHAARNKAYVALLTSCVPATLAMPVHVWLVSSDHERFWVRFQLWMHYGLRSPQCRSLGGTHHSPDMEKLAADLNALLPE